MRLRAAANTHNTTKCVDAYTDRLAFVGQLNLFDDVKRDSETAERRVISVAPGAQVPARRVVEAAGFRWIIGHGNPDTYRGSVIRIGYVVHEATHLARVRTLGQVCRDEAGFEAWAGRAWIKNLAYTEQESRLVPQVHIHFAIGEPVQPDLVVLFDGQLYLVRVADQGPAGTLITLCDQLPPPVIESGLLQVGQWDPLLDQMVGGTVSARVVRIRWQSMFKYLSTIAPAFQPGDLQVAISSTIQVTVGALLTLSDGTWKLASATLAGDVWLCRAVKHA